jgi:hypothetical protein
LDFFDKAGPRHEAPWRAIDRVFFSRTGIHFESAGTEPEEQAQPPCSAPPLPQNRAQSALMTPRSAGEFTPIGASTKPSWIEKVRLRS